MEDQKTEKYTHTLGGQVYWKIGHIPQSKLGAGDHHIPEDQATICTTKLKDRRDRVIVQEKLDGSCMAVVRKGDELIPLNRAGYTALSSPYASQRLFHHWVQNQKQRFLETLEDGERIVGEWLAQAVGTRYVIDHPNEPFQAFDIIKGTQRLPYHEFTERIYQVPNPLGSVRFLGYGPMSIDEALAKLDEPTTQCLDTREGLMYRVEQGDQVKFLAKYVKPTHETGRYLPQISGQPVVWNWKPTQDEREDTL